MTPAQPPVETHARELARRIATPQGSRDRRAPISTAEENEIITIDVLARLRAAAKRG